MNREQLAEQYYSKLNENKAVDFLKKMFLPALVGGGAAYGVNYLLGDDPSGVLKTLLSPVPDEKTNRGEQYVSSTRRGLDKQRAIDLATGAGEGEAGRRLAQIGTTGRERAAARNIMKGRIADLKAAAASATSSPASKEGREQALAAQAELANLEKAYKQTKIGRMNLQPVERNSGATTMAGRRAQYGINPFEEPRSQYDLDRRRMADQDIAAAGDVGYQSRAQQLAGRIGRGYSGTQGASLLPGDPGYDRASRLAEPDYRTTDPKAMAARDLERMNARIQPGGDLEREQRIAAAQERLRANTEANKNKSKK